MARTGTCRGASHLPIWRGLPRAARLSSVPPFGPRTAGRRPYDAALQPPDPGALLPAKGCHSALRTAVRRRETSARDERRRGRPAFVLFMPSGSRPVPSLAAAVLAHARMGALAPVLGAASASAVGWRAGVEWLFAARQGCATAGAWSVDPRATCPCRQPSGFQCGETAHLQIPMAGEQVLGGESANAHRLDRCHAQARGRSTVRKSVAPVPTPKADPVLPGFADA
jgi:hypothetical protein